ncbi:hypothetical protein [Escherichia phage pEC-M719-6WT.1]|uniref:Uncharacterized protein n=1 Tax=Escherichia phage pEC-M719-6WT.1 TaxID=3056220 RepID=A0AA51YFR1_9CAUD|nr:hypothetical protein [Escherichia phage pEC-M719-6WT.1]
MFRESLRGIGSDKRRDSDHVNRLLKRLRTY